MLFQMALTEEHPAITCKFKETFRPFHEEYIPWLTKIINIDQMVSFKLKHHFGMEKKNLWMHLIKRSDSAAMRMRWCK